MKITVPITYGFDNTKIIGIMEIDKEKLPTIPDFCFAIGYYCKNLEGGVVTDFELREVSIVNDLEYQKFLESKYDKL